MLAPIEPFKQRGQSGAWVSDFLPHTAEIADKICFVKSMHTDAVNHAPGISFLLSGGQIPGRPTLGAWMAYGLGAETEELPRFVVMTSVSKGTTCGQIFYDFYWWKRLPSIKASRSLVPWQQGPCPLCKKSKGHEPGNEEGLARQYCRNQ